MEVGLSIDRTFRNDDGIAYVVPNENEWYKAAYYNPATESYFKYGTSNNSLPTREAPPGGTNSANYGPLEDSPTGYPTDVGAYAGSLSPYGLYDMSGNVWDWQETAHLTAGVQRGGSYSNSGGAIPASFRLTYPKASSEYTFGFRVASIPEPGGVTLLLAGVLGLLPWRRRRSN